MSAPTNTGNAYMMKNNSGRNYSSSFSPQDHFNKSPYDLGVRSHGSAHGAAFLHSSRSGKGSSSLESNLALSSLKTGASPLPSISPSPSFHSLPGSYDVKSGTPPFASSFHGITGFSPGSFVSISESSSCLPNITRAYHNIVKLFPLSLSALTSQT
jgi:hypothetical protein